MGSLSNLFSWKSADSNVSELPELFPFPFPLNDFIRIDVINIYTRILTDTLERTEGISDKIQTLLWDNCVSNGTTDGLVSLLAKAMTDKGDLYLVYNKAVNVIKKANAQEQAQIKADYDKKGESAIGIYVTFKNYRRSDMVRLYSQLEYCTIGSLYKGMNLSRAVQLKFTDLRGSVATVDADEVAEQAALIAKGLGDGKSVMLDAKDIVETAKPDLTATQSAIEFINEKRSFYLGLPASYITGAQAKGLSDSGQGDAKATERGLKNYYFAVVKPVIEELFGVSTTFKSEDYESLATILEALKTFDTVSEEFLSAENKLRLINKFFGFPANEKGGPVAPPPEPVNNQPPVTPPKAQ